MQTGQFLGWVLSCLLLSLRVGPVFVFAPPFTLVRLPALFRVMLALGLSACMISFKPSVALPSEVGLALLVPAAASELMLGTVLVLALQLVFGALYTAGRTVDIQAGFGLSTLVDPTTKASTPLVGTMFAYAFGAVFFALDGHGELLRILGASLDAVPLGAWRFPHSLAHLSAFMSAVALVSFGLAGGAILTLFLADLAIALLSRTAPQMNALVFGFQVKTLILLLVLPTSFGVSGALFARLARITLEALPRLVS